MTQEVATSGASACDTLGTGRLPSPRPPLARGRALLAARRRTSGYRHYASRAATISPRPITLAPCNNATTSLALSQRTTYNISSYYKGPSLCFHS